MLEDLPSSYFKNYYCLVISVRSREVASVMSDLPVPFHVRVPSVLSRITASYPDVSLLMKMCAQRKAGRKRLYPSHGPLRFIMITSHSFRALLCHVKNEAPEEEAGRIT